MPFSHRIKRIGARIRKWFRRKGRVMRENFLNRWLVSPGLSYRSRSILYASQHHGIFLPGERFLEIHLNGNGRQIVESLHDFARKLPAFQRRGYVGMFGITPNAAILKYLERRYPVKVYEEDGYSGGQVMESYRNNVFERGYPFRYARAEPKMVYIRFDWIKKK